MSTRQDVTDNVGTETEFPRELNRRLDLVGAIYSRLFGRVETWPTTAFRTDV